MSWKPLDLSSSAGAQLPPFLISSEFNHNSYLVRLTDLTNTWAEGIDRDAIIARSREENPSIDPSEDDDQLSIFLDKIKLGLAREKDTSLSLHVGVNVGSDPLPPLLLRVKVPLPGGLKDLEWQYRLKPQSPEDTAETLVIPSLVALQEERQGIEKLVKLLEEKDVVIQKLVDTLENQGTDLGTIFHQAAGRSGRKVDRKKASEKVRGLKTFDLDDWRSGAGFDNAGDTWDLLNNVFGGGDMNINISPTNDLGRKAQRCGWWDRVHGKTVGTSENLVANSPKDLPNRDTKQQTISSEDDFQVQSTPPHLSKSRPVPDISMDDSTDDDEDDDLNVPSQRSRIPDSLPISQVRAPSPDRTPTPSPSPPPKVKTPINKQKTKRRASTPNPLNLNADDTTEDDDEPILKNSHSTKILDNDVDDNDTMDDDATYSPPPKRPQSPPKPPNPQSPPAKKKGKLGKLGGKRAPSPELEREPDLEPEAEPEATKPRPRRGMLGRIGGKKKETTATPEIEAQSSMSPKKKLGAIDGKKAVVGDVSQVEDTPGEKTRGRGREQKMVEEEETKEKTPRESSQERADKKRETLKRELEAKSKAPVKKKRKF
ncbi:hypothetical protein MFRU_002g01640 [Monilinia fructicola]|uniref:Non-homologous end-joining factor 1 n=1 Tax=Monilinia fructicola TaxID=38448 RepID=A0A5M9K4D8_MONFR|nr:hypothetical protein EYC84_004484 [Monilinia fructicola]KAG4034813.1 hypothetical protein MFRU_002g01640 [Monilinia fructicola]